MSPGSGTGTQATSPQDFDITPYAVASEGDTYMATRLDVEPWDDAATGNKTKALKQATRLIDRLNYIGSVSVDGQERQFPRGGDSDVPTDIKIACMEIALALLDDVNIEMELRNLETISQGFAAVRSTYDRSFMLEYLSAGIPSGVAWEYLKPYLANPTEFDLERVS